MTVIDDSRRVTPTCDDVDHMSEDTNTLNVLLSRIALADDVAFARFYDLTCNRVYGMALRVLCDRGFAEEVTQEAYLQVWRSAGSFRPESGSAISWLVTIAHRRAVDRVRSESASTRRSFEYGIKRIVPDIDQVADAVEIREQRDLVRRGLDTLTNLQRESLELTYFHGLTHREAAELLGVALPTVKSRVRDATKRLGVYLVAVGA